MTIYLNKFCTVKVVNFVAIRRGRYTLRERTKYIKEVKRLEEQRSPMNEQIQKQTVTKNRNEDDMDVLIKQVTDSHKTCIKYIASFKLVEILSKIKLGYLVSALNNGYM